MAESALLIAGGALLTCVLAALLFGPTGSAEERRMREERKLLRALEAQRRIRDARRPRAVKQYGPPVEPSPANEHPELEKTPPAEETVDPRAAKRERKRQEKAEMATLKSVRKAAEQARRKAENERKAALKAERAERRIEEQRRRREEREQALALEAEAKEAVRPVPAEPPPPARAPEPDPAAAGEADEEKPRALTELPLYSWATGIEKEPGSTEAG